MSRYLIAALLAPSPALADIPADETIDEGALLDITPEGFDTLPVLAPVLMPDRIDVATASDGDWWYGYRVSGMWIQLELGDTTIVPRSSSPDGYIDIDAEILVAINSSSTPFELTVELLGASSTCDGYLTQTPIYAAMDLSMSMVDSGDGTPPIMDATVSNLAVDITELDGDDIVLTDCALGTVIEVLDWFSLDVEGLIIENLAAPLLEDSVADLGATLEETLEDAFTSLVIEEAFDLEGVEATVSLYPKDIETTDAGMRLAMAGKTTVSEQAACIAAYDPGYAYSVEGAAPIIRSVPPDVTAGYHAGIFLSDEFGNQALYAFWRGGLLCQTVDEELLGDFTLDTSILTNLATPQGSDEGAYDELFDEGAPLLMVTAPRKAPTLDFAAEPDIQLEVEELGLDMYSEIDHRLTRVVGLDLALEAGADLALDSATGEVLINVDISGDNLTTTTAFNEYAPGSDETIATNMGAVFDSVVGPVLDGVLGDLAIYLPSFSGLGLTSLEISGAGPEQDWLGAFASIGEVSYESAGGCGGGCGGDTGSDSCGGCSSESGCGVDSEGGCTVGDEGCDNWDESSSCGGSGSCSTTARWRGRLFLIVTPFLIAFRRRKPE